MTIQPTSVYTPVRTRRTYDTYNTTTAGSPPEQPYPGGGGGGGRLYNMWQRTPQGPIRVPVSPGVPRFLGARPILFYAWIFAMAMVAWDEWSRYKILPRPARLWDTTKLYGILAIVSVVDVAVPFTNAIAIGFVITLGYQYYSKTGSFSS